MNVRKAIIGTLVSFLIGTVGSTLAAASLFSVPAQAQQTSQPIAKHLGVIKAINGNVLTLTQDSGPEISATVQPNARVLRLTPGDKDLKNATPISLQDLHVGDTVRVRGFGVEDAKELNVLEVIVITQSAVTALTDQMRQDWQKRGIGGPVTSVDPAAGTVTITVSGVGGKKTIVVHTSKNTIIRRYSPDSARPEDAKVITPKEIDVDDQLRARGNRSGDGSQLTAEEIFTGVFPQFPALVKSVDASAGTLSVQDLVTKKTVQLKITHDSQLYKIPAEMAQRLAMRLKAQLPPGAPGAGANSSSSSTPPAGSTAQPGPPSGGAAQGMTGMGGGGATGAGMQGGGTRSGGGFDLQRLLDQTPTVVLADVHSGDAVYVLTTQGTPSGGSTVLKLVGGVEPILQAAPGSQAMTLAPWSLGGAPGGDAASQ